MLKSCYYYKFLNFSHASLKLRMSSVWWNAYKNEFWINAFTLCPQSFSTILLLLLSSPGGYEYPKFSCLPSFKYLQNDFSYTIGNIIQSVIWSVVSPIKLVYSSFCSIISYALIITSESVWTVIFIISWPELISY